MTPATERVSMPWIVMRRTPPPQPVWHRPCEAVTARDPVSRMAPGTGAGPFGQSVPVSRSIRATEMRGINCAASEQVLPITRGLELEADAVTRKNGQRGSELGRFRNHTSTRQRSNSAAEVDSMPASRTGCGPGSSHWNGSDFSNVSECGVFALA